MEVMDYTEKEYLELLAEGYVEMHTRANLYEHFAKDRTEDYEVLATEYEEYVQCLIDKAEIIYK